MFTPSNLAAWSRTYDLRLVQADLTRDDPEALALLRALGSQSIPRGGHLPTGRDGGRPLVLRDFFTVGQFEDAAPGFCR